MCVAGVSRRGLRQLLCLHSVCPREEELWECVMIWNRRDLRCRQWWFTPEKLKNLTWPLRCSL